MSSRAKRILRILQLAINQNLMLADTREKCNIPPTITPLINKNDDTSKLVYSVHNNYCIEKRLHLRKRFHDHSINDGNGYDDVYQANISPEFMYTELKNYYFTEKRMDEIRDNQETSSITDVTTNLHNSMNADTVCSTTRQENKDINELATDLSVSYTESGGSSEVYEPEQSYVSDSNRPINLRCFIIFFFHIFGSAFRRCFLWCGPGNR